MMMRKRKILMSDVTYSNQAKTLFGRRKMTRQATRKMLTRKGLVELLSEVVGDRLVAARGKDPSAQY
jgi:hypothetical protein